MPAERAGSPTFHQRARLEQLVDCTIEIIGESGLGAASVSAVARRAGVSRSVVDYNVGGRERLLDHVVARVYDLGREAVAPSMADGGEPAAALRAFVEASLGFYSERPAEMRALREIFAARTRGRTHSAQHQREIREMEDLLRNGHRTGAFTGFDVALVASTIRAALDVAAARIATGASPDDVRPEVVALVARMVGAG